MGQKIEKEVKKVEKVAKSARTQPFMRNPQWDEGYELFNIMLKEAITALKWLQTYLKKLSENEKEEKT